jgi:hypothetical protein
MRLTGKYLERFLQRVVKSDDGCWTWDGAHTAAGYAESWNGVRPVFAHRVAHEMWIGPIPDGYEVDHLCRNPSCINPEHLEAVPGRVNNLRSNSAGAVNARKTHCPRGHEFTPENTQFRTTPRGTPSRVCRECKNSRRRVAVKKERPLSTHCPQGHPMEGDNLRVYVKKNGKLSRQCRQCSLDRGRTRPQ